MEPNNLNSPEKQNQINDFKPQAPDNNIHVENPSPMPDKKSNSKKKYNRR